MKNNRFVKKKKTAFKYLFTYLFLFSIWCSMVPLPKSATKFLLTVTSDHTIEKSTSLFCPYPLSFVIFYDSVFLLLLPLLFYYNIIYVSSTFLNVIASPISLNYILFNPEVCVPQVYFCEAFSCCGHCFFSFSFPSSFIYCPWWIHFSEYFWNRGLFTPMTYGDIHRLYS